LQAWNLENHFSHTGKGIVAHPNTQVWSRIGKAAHISLGRHRYTDCRNCRDDPIQGAFCHLYLHSRYCKTKTRLAAGLLREGKTGNRQGVAAV